MSKGFNKKQIANKLNTSVGNVNQLILKNKARKGKDFTQKDRQNIYTAAYVKKLEENRGIPRPNRKSVKRSSNVMAKPITSKGSSTIQVSVSVPKVLSSAYTAEFLEKRIQALVDKSIEPQLKKLIEAIQD